MCTSENALPLVHLSIAFVAYCRFEIKIDGLEALRQFMWDDSLVFIPDTIQGIIPSLFTICRYWQFSGPKDTGSVTITIGED